VKQLVRGTRSRPVTNFSRVPTGAVNGDSEGPEPTNDDLHAAAIFVVDALGGESGPRAICSHEPGGGGCMKRP
jgi:hypothetical protein